ncbi:hypothetical protein Hanom_Chr04g00371361 [Helianthus anomalus]
MIFQSLFFFFFLIIQPATEEMSFDEYVHQVGCTLEITPSLSILNGAFDFDFYSPGTGPERIPFENG